MIQDNLNIQYRAIIFDWDGTLADSFQAIYRCKIFLAKKFNQPEPTKETIKSALGMPFNMAIKSCFPNLASRERTELMSLYNATMSTKAYQSKLFPGAFTILNILKANKIKLAIASAKNPLELKTSLEYNGVRDVFDIVCCAKDYKEKPDPLMLEHIMAQFDIIPNLCLMVGDTNTDINFARNAGINAIGVSFNTQCIDSNQDNLLCIINSWNDFLDKICHP